MTECSILFYANPFLMVFLTVFFVPLQMIFGESNPVYPILTSSYHLTVWLSGQSFLLKKLTAIFWYIFLSYSFVQLLLQKVPIPKAKEKNLLRMQIFALIIVVVYMLYMIYVVSYK